MERELCHKSVAVVSQHHVKHSPAHAAPRWAPICVRRRSGAREIPRPPSPVENGGMIADHVPRGKRKQRDGDTDKGEHNI